MVCGKCHDNVFGRSFPTLFIIGFLLIIGALTYQTRRHLLWCHYNSGKILFIKVCCNHSFEACLVLLIHVKNSADVGEWFIRQIVSIPSLTPAFWMVQWGFACEFENAGYGPFDKALYADVGRLVFYTLLYVVPIVLMYCNIYHKERDAAGGVIDRKALWNLSGIWGLWLIYFGQGPLLLSYMNLFACIEVDGFHYMVSEMSIKCGSPEHMSLVWAAGIPGLAIYGIAIPLVGSYLLWKHRKLIPVQDRNWCPPPHMPRWNSMLCP